MILLLIQCEPEYYWCLKFYSGSEFYQNKNQNLIHYMKKFLYLAAFFLVSSQMIAQNGEDAFRSIYAYCFQRDYFTASELFGARKHELSAIHQKYFEAVIYNAFNRIDESQIRIDEILIPENSLPDSLEFRLYETAGDNALKQFNYKKAVEAINVILGNYSGFLTPEQKSDYENDLKLWSALENVPPQQAEINGGAKIRMTKDLVGLNNLPVTINGIGMNFIFDTGANLSTTSQSVADSVGMRFLPVEIMVGTITGEKTPTKLAVCDELKLGEMIFRNVIFLVLPDENLSFPQINYRIFGIIGFPVFESMKELSITQSGQFLVPEKQSAFTDNSNLALDGLTPLIRTNGKHFTFDTGADNTIFYSKYFNENKDEIEKDYKAADIQFGGAAGIKSLKGYSIIYTFHFMGQNVTLDNISVFTEKLRADEFVYGNIGQDFIRRFETMTINFEKMFIELK